MKKTLLLVLAFALVLSLALAACSSDRDGNSSANDPPAALSENEKGDDSSDSEDPQGKANLIPIGTTATSTLTSWPSTQHTASVCVEEVYRGDAALSFINDNMMAEKKVWSATAPDDADQEYIVAKITYSLLAYEDDDDSDSDAEAKSISLTYAYSGTFEAYPNLLAGMFYDKDNGYPELDSIEVPVGETVTAYEIFQVRKDDDAPSMVYGRTAADLSDGLWFKLY
jgi:nitrous oxide reductase accessory protein NosL